MLAMPNCTQEIDEPHSYAAAFVPRIILFSSGAGEPPPTLSQFHQECLSTAEKTFVNT